MSAFSAWSESLAGLAGDSIVLVLVVKWTVMLALAWLAHGMLAGRNPRWRVALWRTTVVGRRDWCAFLSSAPPIVKYRLAPAGAAAVEAVQSVSIAPARKDRGATAAVSAWESIEAIDGAPASTAPAWTEGGNHPGFDIARREPVPSVPARDPGVRWGAGADSWIGVDLADRCRSS